MKTAGMVYLDNTISLLTRRCELLKEAFKKMREASFQSHNGHWDSMMTRGSNCPECIRAINIRKEADDLFEKAINHKQEE